MDVSKINVIAPDEVRILPIEDEAKPKKSTSPDEATSGRSLMRGSSAGQRRLRAETQPNANVALVHANNNISPEALDALVKYGNNPQGWSALSYAIDVAHDWTAAAALIEAGIGINSKDGPAGYTPIVRLMMLAVHGHPPYRENGTKLLRNLILKGIDISLPMGYSLNQGQFVLAGVGLFYNPHLNAELDLFLTKYPIDLNSFPKGNGMNPIQQALQSSYIDMVKILLQHGSKVDKIDCFSYLFNHTNIAAEMKEMISLLINHGANPLRASDLDPKMTSIDHLLKKILSLPNDNHYADYKREMIPYLMNLGAQIR